MADLELNTNNHSLTHYIYMKHSNSYENGVLLHSCHINKYYGAQLSHEFTVICDVKLGNIL
jgi:hypothetical protein